MLRILFFLLLCIATGRRVLLVVEEELTVLVGESCSHHKTKLTFRPVVLAALICWTTRPAFSTNCFARCALICISCGCDPSADIPLSLPVTWSLAVVRENRVLQPRKHDTKTDCSDRNYSGDVWIGAKQSEVLHTSPVCQGLLSATVPQDLVVTSSFSSLSGSY